MCKTGWGTGNKELWFRLFLWFLDLSYLITCVLLHSWKESKVFKLSKLKTVLLFSLINYNTYTDCLFFAEAESSEGDGTEWSRVSWLQPWQLTISVNFISCSGCSISGFLQWTGQVGGETAGPDRVKQLSHRERAGPDRRGNQAAGTVHHASLSGRTHAGADVLEGGVGGVSAQRVRSVSAQDHDLARAHGGTCEDSNRMHAPGYPRTRSAIRRKS